MKLRPEVKAYVEAELRDYHQTKLDLIELREDIAAGHNKESDDSGVVTHRIGRPTEAKALALITNKRIKRMEQAIKAIEIVTGELTEEKIELVKLKYWQRPRRLTDAGIAMELRVDRRTLYRWSEAVCLAIAIEMGLVNETCHKHATFRG